MSTNHPSRAQQLDARRLATEQGISYTAALQAVRAGNHDSFASDAADAEAGRLAFPTPESAAHRRWHELFRTGRVRLGHWTPPTPPEAGNYVDMNLEVNQNALFVAPLGSGKSQVARTFAVGAGAHPDLFESYYVDADGDCTPPAGVTHIHPSREWGEVVQLVDQLHPVVRARRLQLIERGTRSLYRAVDDQPASSAESLSAPKRIVLMVDGYDRLQLPGATRAKLLDMTNAAGVGFHAVLTTRYVPDDNMVDHLGRQPLLGLIGPQPLEARNGTDLSTLIPVDTAAGRVHAVDDRAGEMYPFQAYRHTTDGSIPD